MSSLSDLRRSTPASTRIAGHFRPRAETYGRRVSSQRERANLRDEALLGYKSLETTARYTLIPRSSARSWETSEIAAMAVVQLLFSHRKELHGGWVPSGARMHGLLLRRG